MGMTIVRVVVRTIGNGPFASKLATQDDLKIETFRDFHNQKSTRTYTRYAPADPNDNYFHDL